MAPFERALSMWDWMFFRACLEMTGPVVVDGSWGSPSLYLVFVSMTSMLLPSGWRGLWVLHTASTPPAIP